jgi:phospholipid transport system substrate-binding protein
MFPQPAKNLVFALIEPSKARRSSAAVRIWLLIAMLVAAAPAAEASQPIDVLRQSIDEGLRILNDPACHISECKTLQKERLRRLLYRDFDFTEFSRRVLAHKWNLFSEAQRLDFTEAFSRFLAEHYLSRLQQNYRDEKFLLHAQTLIAADRAVVRSGVVWMNRELSVDVRMHSAGGTWKVYDVVVIGVSAVQIYRAQFQHLLRTRSPAQVIELVKKRIAEEGG